MQMRSCGESKVHLTFLRRHSQQLCVPFRTFLRLGGFSSGGEYMSEVVGQIGRRFTQREHRVADRKFRPVIIS